MRTIFNAPDQATTEVYLPLTVAKYATTDSGLAAWMEKNLGGVHLFKGTQATHSDQQQPGAIKRRTRVARIFPNEAACLRLVSAILIEICEGWETGKI